MNELVYTTGKESFVDMSKIDPTVFNIVSKDGLTLIYPRKNKFKWEQNERWLRSVVINENNKIVSCGWPKFGNYNEFINDTILFCKELENGVVRFTNKEDGSLCIRSVINDTVVFRTRGTIFGDSMCEGYGKLFNEVFISVAKNKYPILLDSKWCNDVNLLFEFVSPQNPIVIRYNEEDLIFIGGVTNNLNILGWDKVQHIAKDFGLNLVKTHTMPNSISEIIDIVNKASGEGIVARFNDDQNFVKIKNKQYLLNHSLKHKVTYKSVVELVYEKNIQTEDELLSIFNDMGLDWEVVDTIKDCYKTYVKATNEFSNYVDDLKLIAHNIVSNICLTDKGEARKEYAMAIGKYSKFDKSLLFGIYDGKYDLVDSLVKKAVLNIGEA